ncbi:porin [Neisseria gonorrhoeae]
MKKSLIALTLAALPVAATADVTLYGAIKAGVQTYRSVEHREGKVVGVGTGSEISDFGSKIGFKGQEDLGNGLKAVWQLEQGASVAGTNTGWGNKQSFVGLKGGFGTIRAGSLNSPLKNTKNNVNAWESGKFTGNVLEISGMAQREHRYLSVRYDSPEFAGFSGSVQYAPKDNSGSNGESYHVGLNYRNNGFFAQYAGLFQRYGEGTKMEGYAYRYAYRYAYNIPSLFVEKLQVHRLVGGYDNNALYASVAAQQQDAKLYGAMSGNSHNSQTEVAATVAYHFGNVTPRVSYAHGFKGTVDDANHDNTYDQVVVGAEYDFSKRTSALVSAGWLQEGKGADKIVSTASAVVLRHKF